MNIIGVDFGNVNTFPYIIQGMDRQTLKGGVELPLLPASGPYNSGIPSYFFFSQRRGRLYGLEAKTASPSANRRWMLKRRISRMDPSSIPEGIRAQTFPSRETVDGQEIDFEDVISEMIQYIVRRANEVLQETTGETTNKVALAYPVDFVPSEVIRLIELAERGTLTDGRHIEVVGTIPEPAAAALAYLNSLSNVQSTCNVAVYDLGGGTLDVASVTAYPNGKMINGSRKYYEVMAMDGLQVGGLEFDNILGQLVQEQLPSEICDNLPGNFQMEIEEAKKRLSDNDDTEVWVNTEDIIITRSEFETRARPLVQRTVELLANMLERQNVPKPDYILLTGGQSQMPLIREMLTEKFPDYQDRIIMHRPQQAIAVGAARYGHQRPFVQEYNRFPLGVRCIDRQQQPNRDYVVSLIPAESALPTTGAAETWHTFYTSGLTNFVRCRVYEARHDNPEPYEIDRDFQQTMECVLRFPKDVPEGTPIEICLFIDERHLVQMRVRDPKKPSQEQTCSVQLVNVH